MKVDAASDRRVGARRLMFERMPACWVGSQLSGRGETLQGKRVRAIRLSFFVELSLVSFWIELSFFVELSFVL